MKSKKAIIYINFLVVFFALIVLILKVIHFSYFDLLTVSLSLLSILFLLVAIYMFYSEKENITISTLDKENIFSKSILEEQEIKETYSSILLSVDKKQDIHFVLEQKIQLLSDTLQIVGALVYVLKDKVLYLESTYALVQEELKNKIKIGEGLTGQVAKNGIFIEITSQSKIDFEIVSNLGHAKPNFLYILPVFRKKEVVAVVEIATFIEIENIDNLIEILKLDD